MARRQPPLQSVSDLFASSERSYSVHIESSQDFQNDSNVHFTRARAKKLPSLASDQRAASVVLSNLPDFSSYERHELVVESYSRGTDKGGTPQSHVSMEGQLVHLDVAKSKPVAHLSPQSYNLNKNLVSSTPEQVFTKQNPVIHIVPLEHLQATPIPRPPPAIEADESLVQRFSSASIHQSVPPSPPPMDTCNSTNSNYRVLNKHSKEFRLCLDESKNTVLDHNHQLPPTRQSMMQQKQEKRTAAFVKRLSRRLRIDNMILNKSYWSLYEAGDPKATLLKLCKQNDYEKFSHVFSAVQQRRGITKIGEGCFGEVFRCSASDDLNTLVAVKLVPIEGKVLFNGDPQKTFSEVLSEVIVAKELTALSVGWRNRTENFVQLRKVHVVRGAFPSYLTKAWECYDRERKSENDHPRIFPRNQLWLVMESLFSGCALDNNVPSCPAARLSILRQIGLALACAEAELRFEHRDLHWGNVLIRRQLEVDTVSIDRAVQCHYCEGSESLAGERVTFLLNERRYNVPSYGFLAVIIDFTLSRLEQDCGLVYVNLATDSALFESQGDYQFDVYRLMREHNGNQWDTFSPKSNIMWLHYLASKLTPTEHSSSSCPSLLHSEFNRQLFDLEQSLSSFDYDSAVDLTSRHPVFTKL